MIIYINLSLIIIWLLLIGIDYTKDDYVLGDTWEK